MKLILRAAVMFLMIIFIVFLVILPNKQPPLPQKLFLQLKPSVPIGLLINTPGCVLPKFEIVSSEVMPLFKHDPEPFDCGGRPQVIESQDSKLVINKQILREHYESDFARCRYWNVIRDNKNTERPDDSFVLVEPAGESDFESEIYPETDVVFVQCSDRFDETFYKNYHAVISREREDAKSKVRKPDNRLNIIIVGIDSVSKLNFLRHFRKTHKLLKNLGAIELHGYNKVEDSTLVNMIPFLTGKYVTHYWNGSEPSLFDHVDEMWRYFSEVGYRTLFGEDFPDIGMFNFQKKGFLHPPTDHYYRPYAVSVDQSFVKRRSKKYCIDDTIEPMYLIRWVEQFIRVYKDQPFYAFSWSSSMTHNLINMAGYLDDPYHDFIRNLNDTGTLNNSMLVFLSDHGIRFGDILETYVGRFEQRLPFFFLVLPSWFHKQHPNVAKNLKINQHRLVTPFDMYETQKDLLIMAGGQHLVHHMNKSPGISLFRQIPSNRTCEMATISPHFCACDQYTSVDVENDRVVVAAHFAVTYVNNITQVERHQCIHLELRSIHEASYMVHSRVLHNYRVVITVTPGSALFESTVRYNTELDSFNIEGSVTRINKYGDQSVCTHRSQLKPYCLCAGYY